MKTHNLLMKIKQLESLELLQAHREEQGPRQAIVRTKILIATMDFHGATEFDAKFFEVAVPESLMLRTSGLSWFSQVVRLRFSLTSQTLSVSIFRTLTLLQPVRNRCPSDQVRSGCGFLSSFASIDSDSNPVFNSALQPAQLHVAIIFKFVY